MKITSLTLQAFRGFNKKVKLSFEKVDIIVLYGPNGHGKTSIYDAIEWGLTGGIHRFDEASPERNRTRFIRNLHADSADKSYVELGIILADEKRYIIERECTGSYKDRSDYGKYILRIFDEKGHLYKENEEAEKTLAGWLIYEEWLPKINSSTTMLGLTHILSQEKIAEFLRGMQERDRYDAISTIFGTDYFDKYREGFRIVRNTLNSEIDKLIIKIREKELILDKLQDEVKKLEVRLKENENTNFTFELEHYINEYPEIKDDQDDLGKILKHIQTNQQAIEIELKKLQRERILLDEIKRELPNISRIRENHNAILREQQLLQQFKKLSISKSKIEQLLLLEDVSNDDRLTVDSLNTLQKESTVKVDILLRERKSLLRQIESIEIQLDTLFERDKARFLKELKPNMKDKDYDILKNSFKGMLEAHQYIERQKSIQEEHVTQLRALDESIKTINSTDVVYGTFLSTLNQYVSLMSEEINNCPACGTEEISKVDILNNIQKQQLQVNKKLPELEKLRHQIKAKIKRNDEEISFANTNIKETKKLVQELLNRLNNDLKTIDKNISIERQNQKNQQEEINSLKLKLNQFEEDCTHLGLSLDNNIREKLELKNQELGTELYKINSVRFLEMKSKDYLPNELKVERFEMSKIDEHEQVLQELIVKDETEISRVDRLAKLSENLNVDIKTADLSLVDITIVEEMKKIDQRLIKLTEIESISINLQSMIGFNAEKMRLIDLQKELAAMKFQVKELKNQEIEMNKDSANLLELINKSAEAVSNLNERVFSKLKETIQIIFEQINSHPVFTRLDLVLDKYRNNNCLTISVSKMNGTKEVKANAPYVFSSAQVNSIALSLFLAMSMKQKWSSLQLIGMDDPIQSMDEVNVISFIDLMRLFVDKHKKQIIISTHDNSFYNMILKKFRYHNLSTIEYESYSDKGPTIKMHNSDTNINKHQLDLIYEKARDALLQLDTNE